MSRKHFTVGSEPGLQKRKSGYWRDTNWRKGNRKGYHCPLCPESFGKDEDFKAHWKERHNNDVDRARAHRNVVYALRSLRLPRKPKS
jgi:hypothetical protein